MSDPGGVLSFCKAFVATFAFSFCPGRTKFAFLANAEAPRAPSPRRLKRKARPKVGMTASPVEVGPAPTRWWVANPEKVEFFSFKKGRTGRMLNSLGKMPAVQRMRPGPAGDGDGDEMNLFEWVLKAISPWSCFEVSIFFGKKGDIMNWQIHTIHGIWTICLHSVGLYGKWW